MLRRKQKKDWLSNYQLDVLEKIAGHGFQGVFMFDGDLSLKTIKALASRGYIESKSGFRVRVTRSGRNRLKQPRPKERRRSAGVVDITNRGSN